jgi:hypothetical protein
MSEQDENFAQDKDDQLLQLTKVTTAPAPFSTEGSGEFWSWGKFFMAFQKNPKTMIEAMYEIQGKSAPEVPLKYHYALSVYYHLNENPYGPSQRPLLIYTLEQADLSIFKELMSANDSMTKEDIQELGDYTTKLCKFERDAHFNMGDYEGGISDREVREKFLSLMKDDLNPEGGPVHHGNLSDAWGHEKSGLPAKTKKSGCLTSAIVSICVGITIVGLLLL